MSHIRIVSSPAPVAIWYLFCCWCKKHMLGYWYIRRGKDEVIPVRREGDGENALYVTVKHHGCTPCSEVPDTTNCIESAKITNRRY